MKLIISDKSKKNLFLALSQILKGCTSIVSIIFNDDHVYIQGMDKSHVCLFDVKITEKWFDSYETSPNDCSVIAINTFTLNTILGIVREDQIINILYEGDPDSLNIELVSPMLTSKNNYDKFFSIPLAELNNELLEVPDTYYDAEFSMSAKKINELMNQMLIFGENIKIICNDENINLVTNGELGKMLVTIPIDDLDEYSIAENEIIELYYSLTYINKMCLTTKLSDVISFCISKEFPMKISYDLGENSHLLLYLAPKIED